MIYVKSMLVGLLTLFIATVLFVVVQEWPALTALKMQRSAEVGIDVVALLHSPRFWIVPLVGFAIGFWWQFRRASA